MEALDPHSRPPASLQQLYKHYQRLPAQQTDLDLNIVDFKRQTGLGQVKEVESVLRTGAQMLVVPSPPDIVSRSPVFESQKVPGLCIVPALFSPAEQLEFASLLLHRDLADARHQTNLHKHYQLPYELASASCDAPLEVPTAPASFFRLPDDAQPRLRPLDAAQHRPLTARQFLGRKLRWVTLGGQYDWSAKAYPAGAAATPPPPFPADLAAVLRGAWPALRRPEAAIVNVYSPGDTLALHRDVAEACAADLVSVSLGCDALFVAGLGGEGGEAGKAAGLAVRLRSGDVVVMRGAARYAWHGVPKVLPGICAGFLADWPADTGEAAEREGRQPFEAWRGWMAGKRINLNVRQMFD